jgi:hypothetical protein
MKIKIKILCTLFLLFSSIASATTYYISTTGTDGSGHTGLIADPWLSLSYAVSRSTSGDIIHIKAGTNLVPTQVAIPVGISIDGDGVTSILKCDEASYSYTATLLLHSNNEGTDGAQFIRNVKFDGDSYTASLCVHINRRSNVKVYNCTFINFKYGALVISGSATSNAAPTIYATGNEVFNNTFTDCAGYYNNVGYGEVAIGGQDGLLIYNNIIDQSTRTPDQNAKCIGYWNSGFNKNVKIHNNSMYHSSSINGNTWDFAIELTNNLGGMEIYNNVMTGAIDGDFQYKGTSAYSLYVHDNEIYRPTRTDIPQAGIRLENHCSDVWIMRNHFYNIDKGIMISAGAHADDIISNIYMQYNIFDNIGQLTTAWMSTPIYFYSGDGCLGSVHNIYIDNNVFVGFTGNGGGRIAITLPSDKSISYVYVRNNIFQGWDYTYLAGSGSQGGSCNYFYVQNNIMYQNGASNLPYWTNSYTVANQTIANNILATNPLFNSKVDFNLQSGSPAIHAGTNVGLTRDFRGASIIGVPDIGAYEYTGAITTTLPVQVTSFTGVVQGNTVALDWKTATEVNSYSFEIERRTSAQLQWESIGTLHAGGTSNAPLDYMYIDSLKNVGSGSIFYRLKSTANDGSFQYNGEVEMFVTTSVAISVPNKYALSQNYPNPFNPTTTINYQLQKAGSVSLKVYDMLGREVVTLVNEGKTAGYFSVVFDASRMSSGTYIYRLQSGTFTEVKKLVLLK